MVKKMGHQILRLFLEHPGQRFHVRQISRLLKLPKSTANYRLQKLAKERYVQRIREGIFPSYQANTSSSLFRLHKRQYGERMIIESGLIEYLERECTPRCIVLFGSFAKGEFAKESDIDLFVEAKEQEVNLRSFEKKLGHPIQILFEDSMQKLSPELFNNIISGIKLYGSIKIR